ncbi:dehydrogenase [Sphingomonas sp. DBB INV C78]|uniref:Gfo/Idh/MocA family protein n=1 Tax=Sphingomonas sp. DBB INV C78 TaxID=3349434 RepID=UPI0036D23837
MTIAIGIVGIGKIARDQHIPTIARDDRFRFAGAVSRHAQDLGVPVAATLVELKDQVPDLGAIAVCTPPSNRLALLREAFALGLDVLMEKPPAATLSEAEHFLPLAAASTSILYQSWHSRAAPAVEPAREWLASRRIRKVRVDWLEDVRVWHPGQEWIWNPGVGVFDPGINALSILTQLFATHLSIECSNLAFPSNRSAPIRADLRLVADAGFDVDLSFAFDQAGPQTWTIAVATEEGMLVLGDGGASWSINGTPQAVVDNRPEYARVYDRFATLIEARADDIDLSPFRLVADAFLLGDRADIGPFDW